MITVSLFLSCNNLIGTEIFTRNWENYLHSIPQHYKQKIECFLWIFFDLKFKRIILSKSGIIENKEKNCGSKILKW